VVRIGGNQLQLAGSIAGNKDIPLKNPSMIVVVNVIHKGFYGE
jgi:hypothetical protein